MVPSNRNRACQGERTGNRALVAANADAIAEVGERGVAAMVSGSVTVASSGMHTSLHTSHVACALRFTAAPDATFAGGVMSTGSHTSPS
jgi:hypothetical protein